MATTKTRNDLVRQALANLGVLAAGQNPSAEDFSAVDGQVDQTLASLDARSIVSVPEDSEIPPEVFQPLAVILANDCAIQFGLAGVPASSSNPNPLLDAENKLREITYGRPTGESQEADYF